MFVDIGFAALVEQLTPACPSVHTYVALTDRANMPAIDVPNLLCYMSGTTGNPKPVATRPWPRWRSLASRIRNGRSVR